MYLVFTTNWGHKKKGINKWKKKIDKIKYNYLQIRNYEG